MTPALIGIGCLLLIAAMVDALVTTLAAGSGGGPLTARLGKWTATALKSLPGGPHQRLLTYTGMLVLLVTVLTWVALLWGGWALVFSSSDGAVLSATSRDPASVPARIYYAGFVVFTLGVGDFVAGSGTWQVATAGASFMGLFLITLSITYLVSVVSAAVGRRALARDISLSGETGVDIVLLHWNGSGVSSQLASLTQSLNAQILQVSQQHLAYPVLHHFHASSPASSAPRAVAALDDALLILSAGLREDVRPDDDVLTRLRRALEHYGETVGRAEVDRAVDPAPPLPDLAALRAVGVPTVDDAELAAGAEQQQKRRRQVRRLVEADASSWPVRS